MNADRHALVARWYEAGVYRSNTLSDELREVIAPGRIVFATADDVDERDAADIRARAERLASGLVCAGLRRGDIVAIQAPTSADTMALAAAVWLAGGVVLPIVDIYQSHEVAFILGQSGARTLAVPTEWRGRRYADEALTCHAATLDTVIAVGPGPPAGSVTLADLDVDGPSVTTREVDADEVALLVYTSGTTADPKGVQHTHNTILTAVRGSVATDDGPTTTLASFPAGHIAGVLGFLHALLCGGTTIVLDRWSPRRAAELIEAYRVTSTSGTPFYLATLLDEAERSGRDISSLGAFLAGAAAVPPPLLDRAAAAGIISWRAYGSTEHPVISAGHPGDTPHQRHHTDGEVVPGAEVRILDDAGKELPVGSDGDIVVRGPKQFVGYRDASLDADAFLPGGWFRTGDIGHLDADGHLTITDRRKDIIIRGGENISSKEVEDVLMLLPDVSEVAVCAAPDQVYGEAVCAFVVLRQGATLDLNRIREHFASIGVTHQKTPTRLELVNDFPRTASGKVRKVDLRRAAARPLAPATSSAEQQPGAN